MPRRRVARARRPRLLQPTRAPERGRPGAPVGASQVRALLRLADPAADDGDYRVNIGAKLTNGYWVRLTAEANRYALDLLTGRADPVITTSAEEYAPAQLAQAARRAGGAEGIDSGIIAVPDECLVDTDVLLKIVSYRLAKVAIDELNQRGMPARVLGAARFMLAAHVARGRRMADLAAVVTELAAVAPTLVEIEPTVEETALAAEVEALAQSLGSGSRSTVTTESSSQLQSRSTATTTPSASKRKRLKASSTMTSVSGSIPVVSTSSASPTEPRRLRRRAG